MAKTKRKPGPKPKPAHDRFRVKSFTFPSDQADFLDTRKNASDFMQTLLAKSPEFQQYLKEKSPADFYH